MRSRYLDVEDRTQDLADLLRSEPALAQEFLRKYELSWVYHENALEGVIFSGQEIEQAYENQPLAEASSVATLRAVRNYKLAIERVRGEAATRRMKIDLSLVKELCETLRAGPEPRPPTEYRKEMPLHRAYFHDIAQPAKIAGQLAKLMDWCQSPEFRAAHAIQKASKLHHAFMQVYPYTDGSGKIARLLANLILIHHGYQPCIFHSIDRQRYYESLRLPESALREFMLESMENGIANGERFIHQALAARSKKAVR
jgi:Fic family protein